MPDPTLHHIGYVTASVATSVEKCRASFGAITVSSPFDDPIQRARVAFIQIPAYGSIPLEFVEPLAVDSPVAAFLKKGGGLHHLCFEVDDVDAQIREMKSHKAALVRSPQTAVALGGRRIAWMFTSEKMLIEYVERHLAEQPQVKNSGEPLLRNTASLSAI